MTAAARDPAPVVIFTYRRLHLLRQVIESLQANPESARTHLIAYSDGPRSENDRPEVEEVRAYLRSLSGFRSVELRFRDRNLGLAESFIGGITETLEDHERAIFLEDDNLLSPHFLRYMNEALARYADDDRVVCITGYSFPVWPRRKAPFFIRGAETWSMATWRRGWRIFERDGAKLRERLRELRLENEVNRVGIDFRAMLDQQIEGRVNSWGVRWWVSAFVEDRYCLYPHEPLCVSIGWGEGSVHCTTYDPLFRERGHLARVPITGFPDTVQESQWTTFLLRVMNRRLGAYRLVRGAWRRIAGGASKG